MPYLISPKVLFGKGALKRLGPEIKGQGTRAVLITDKTMVKYTLIRLGSSDPNMGTIPCECEEENLRQLFQNMWEGKR